MATAFITATDLEEPLFAAKAKILESQLALADALELMHQAAYRAVSVDSRLGDAVRFRSAIENQLSILVSDVAEFARADQPEVTRDIVLDELDELIDLVKVSGGGDGR